MSLPASPVMAASKMRLSLPATDFFCAGPEPTPVAHHLQLVIFRLSRPCSRYGSHGRLHSTSEHHSWPVRCLHERAQSYPDIHSWPVPLQLGAVLWHVRWTDLHSRLTILLLTYLCYFLLPSLGYISSFLPRYHLSLLILPAITCQSQLLLPHILSFTLFFGSILVSRYSHLANPGNLEQDSALQRLQSTLLTPSPRLSVCNIGVTTIHPLRDVAFRLRTPTLYLF